MYTKYHIADLIKKYNITKILSFHFALTPSAAAAIKLLNRKIPLITDITDPYSAHPSWYLEKSSTFIVHSQELENEVEGIISIDVIPNKELISELIWFKDDVEVLSPGIFRAQIGKKIAENYHKYFPVQNDCIGDA